MRNVKRFNKLFKGRCKDKMRALSNLCELSELQYNILCYKWCSGRRGYTRDEIAYKCNTSTSTIDREYADIKNKINALMNQYDYHELAGDFYFIIDEVVNNTDWSNHIKSKALANAKLEEIKNNLM